MPRNGSGTMTALSTLAPPGTVSNSTLVNANQTDINTELTDSLSRSGKGGMLAALAMGNNKITGVANGTLATDVPSLAQVQSDIVKQASTVGGTADAITLAFTPTLTALSAGAKIRWTSAGANTTTTPTITADGFGPYIVKSQSNGTLNVGDLGASGTINEAVFNGTAFQLLGVSTANVAKTNAANTFTANQVISSSNPTLVLNASASAQQSGFLGQTAASNRWQFLLSDGSAESGSNAGTNITFARFSDAGSYIDNPFYIYRQTGTMQIKGMFTAGATGGDKGAGTVNATGYYLNGNAQNAASGLVALDASSKLPAVDGSQLTNIAAQPKAITSTGVGQFVTIGSNAANTAVVLPAGGTWLWFVIYVPTSGTAVPVGSPAAGISAGGSTVLGANANAAGMGFAWRMT